MNAKVISITGFEGAFTAMFLSKRTYTPELGKEIMDVCSRVVDRYGRFYEDVDKEDNEKFNKWLSMLLKMGRKHITVLRFLSITIMTEGLHRAGQDDVDAHVKRFENKIIRNSTRLATYRENEVSDWYKGKILTDGQAAEILGIKLPDTIEYMGRTYVKSTNGYVREEYKDNKDVKRGLYMLSIPSDFVSEISLCEWAHVYKERNETGGANPEVKMWAEFVMEGISSYIPQFTREYILSVEN